MDDEGGKEADRHSSGYQPEKFQHGQARPGPSPGDDQCNGKLEREQPTGVVDQAFAFQYVNDPAGKTEAFGDCGGGDRIGG